MHRESPHTLESIVAWHLNNTNNNMHDTIIMCPRTWSLVNVSDAVYSCIYICIYIHIQYTMLERLCIVVVASLGACVCPRQPFRSSLELLSGKAGTLLASATAPAPLAASKLESLVVLDHWNHHWLFPCQVLSQERDFSKLDRWQLISPASSVLCA